MSAEIVVYGVSLGVPERAVLQFEAYRAAAMRANTITASYAIKNKDDRDIATLDRAAIKAGIKVLQDAVKSRAWISDPELREAFSALEAADGRAKAEVKRLVGVMTSKVAVIDAAIVAWTRAEEERARLEEAKRREAEEAAAKAAAEAAASNMDPDEEAPPPAQPIVPRSEPAQRHSVVGSAKSTVKSSPVKCEFWMDPAIDAAEARAAAVLECAKRWPHLLVLDEVAAKAEFNALVARRQVERPSEAGTVIGGVRFYTTPVVSG